MKRKWLFAMLAALASVGCGAGAPPPVTAPRLVVLLVIDQLPSWTFDARRSTFTHGLRRLLDEGVYIPRAQHLHAYTYTASGHAVIGTGATPSSTGIIANSWYRREQLAARAAEDDDATRLFSIDGSGLAAENIVGASASALRVPGLAEALRSGGGGRSVTIALKARAACFMAGQKPDVALFYDEDLNGFTTSTAYVSALPSWVVALDRDHPASRFNGAVWTPSVDASVLAEQTRINDDGVGESPAPLGTTFPHQLPNPANHALNATPFGDELVADAAIAAIVGENLGQDEVADLLAVSFSSHDYAAHLWGQESWEEYDLLARLDGQIGRLLEALDSAVGADHYAVVLSSDHGATPMIDSTSGARRIPTNMLEETIETAMSQTLGDGDWVVSVSSMMVYLSETALALGDSERNLAIDDAIQAITALGVGIGRFDVLAAQCQEVTIARVNPSLSERLCKSYVAGQSGDLYLVPPEGSLITDATTGTHHDAPSVADRDVPLILRVPGTSARTYVGSVSTLQIAPTVSELLGVDPPSAAIAEPVSWR